MARILIVDDEVNILIVLQTVLGFSGHEIVTALGGEKAVELLATSNFDLLISDVRMYPMDGLELLKLARVRHPDLPAILITAFDLPAMKRMTESLGPFGYLRKPFSNTDLISAVDKAVSSTKGTGTTDPRCSV